MMREYLNFALPLLLALLSTDCRRSDDTAPTVVKSNDSSPEKGISTTRSIDPRIAAFFGGPQMTDIITDADDVQAFRLDDVPRVHQSTAPKQNTQNIDGYNMIAGPIAVTGDTREILVTNLTNPDSYFFDAASGCIPHWDVAYRFRKSDHILDMVICLHCGIIEKYYDGNLIQGSIAAYMSNGARIIAHRLFPQDAALKDLRSPGDQ
jgi:hypothetical protein